MSIVNNFTAGTLIEYASKNPATTSGKVPINVGNKQVQNLSVNEFVLSGDGSYKKVIAKTENADTNVKKITFSNLLTLKVDASSTVNIGDTFTLAGNNTVTVTSIEDASTATCYSITVEGGESVVLNDIIVSL